MFTAIGLPQRMFKLNRMTICGSIVSHEEQFGLRPKYFKFDGVGEQKTGLVLASAIPGVNVVSKPDINFKYKPAKYVGCKNPFG
ncbi:hypothetical protein BV898_04017 [Hypsibius exemplaris]|uniref:Uncharacterized protein n=1 Tax=Hypsibius exemplaris TaxID=2072580 RepID=A0A1W0X431_HYPEX|nr:hypothetical protein BV898_04017 [Hypsibius exemplaris]